jgi:hypothetical protein
MERKEKCELAIKKGYTYNPDSGKVIGPYGREVIKIDGCGYVSISTKFKNKQLRLRVHQFGWYYIYGEIVEQIDHINGVKDDNRICNLRSVTNQQNQWNRKTAKGYYFNKEKNKWQSNIRVNNKTIYLGRYNTEEDARAAYLAAKEKYHKINNPQ